MHAITTTQAAERLGVTRQWISALCCEHGIGTLVNPRMRLLSEQDFRRLARIRTDNPCGGTRSGSGRKPAAR